MIRKESSRFISSIHHKISFGQLLHLACKLPLANVIVLPIDVVTTFPKTVSNVLKVKFELKKLENQAENYTYTFPSIFPIRLELNLQSTAIANGPIEGIKRLNPVVIIADLTLKPFGNHFVVLSGLN